MKMPSRMEIETHARALRHAEFSRLWNMLMNNIGQSMQRHHEARLRRTPVVPVSAAAAIGTPV